MSIIDSIKEKAEAIIAKATPYAPLAERLANRSSNIYDPSKNVIIIAGITLEGWTSATINSDTVLGQEQGIDHRYTAMYTKFEQRTLTISFLPTSWQLFLLRDLTQMQLNTKGWFRLSISENGILMNVYHAQVISTPEITMDRESQDRTFTFLIKTMPDIPVLNNMNQEALPLEQLPTEIVDNPEFEQDSLGKLIDERTNKVEPIINNTVNVIPTPPPIEPLPETPQ